MARALLVRKPLAHSLGTTQLVVPRADMARPATRSLVEIRSKAASNPRTRAMVTVASRAATIKVEVNLGPVGNHGISNSGNVDTECH